MLVLQAVASENLQGVNDAAHSRPGTHARAAGAEPSTDANGLRRALVLDGRGGARRLNDWAAVERWRPEHGALWLDVDPRVPGVMVWMIERSGLSAEQFEELYHCEFRSCFRQVGKNCFALSLRGYDPTLGEVSGHLTNFLAWHEPGRALTLTEFEGQGAAELEESLLEGRGPQDLPALAARFPSEVSAVLFDEAKDIEQSMAELEYQAQSTEAWTEALRDAQVRISRLRRQGAPIHVIIDRGLEMGDTWLIQSQIETWRTAAEQVQDADDLLQTLHERSLTIHRYVSERLALRINKVLVVLTMVSTIVLPLSLIASILSMHVGLPGDSYPGLGNPIAFPIVVAILILIAVVQYFVMKRRKLLLR